MRFRPCLHILIVLIYSFCFSQSELDWNFNSEGFSNEVIFPVESLYETESGFENLPIGSLIGIFMLMRTLIINVLGIALMQAMILM